MRQALDKTTCERISDRHHDDRDSGGHGCGGPRDNGALGHDDIDGRIHQRDGEFREPRDISVAPLRDQNKISPLHVATIGKCAQECIEFALRRRRGTQETDAPHPVRLLRARRQRPSRRAAKERDELATPQSDCIALLTVPEAAYPMAAGASAGPGGPVEACARTVASAEFLNCCHNAVSAKK
jgi:hypothetical protein